MKKSKILLWALLTIYSGLPQVVVASQPGNSLVALFLNWPVCVNQPQFQMEVNPKNASESYYGSEGFEGAKVTNQFGTWKTYIFGGTSTQTQGYYSAVAGSSSQSPLTFTRPNLSATAGNPGYIKGVGVVSWADILFAARASLRQWMEGLDAGGIFPAQQAVSLQSVVSGGALAFSSLLWPQDTQFYGAGEPEIMAVVQEHLMNFSDVGDINWTTCVWFDGVPLTADMMVFASNGSSLAPKYLVNANRVFRVQWHWGDEVPSNPTVKKIDYSSSYVFPGYWSYYINPSTLKFTNLYNEASSVQGVPEYFSQATFLTYLQQVQNNYLTSSLGSTGNYTNVCAAAWKVSDDAQKPSATVSPENFISLLPGMASNSSSREVFFNLFITNNPNTQAALGTASNNLLEYTPLYNLKGSLSGIAGLSGGDMYYLPLVLSDPGHPYVPVAWNYATAITEFEPLKTLQSDFSYQLQSEKSVVQVGS